MGLYCAGLSLNATGKRLGVSAQSVMRWIRDHARRTTAPSRRPTGRAVVVEIDEMWHFVEKRRDKLWIWKALERGDRSADRLGMRRPRPGHAGAAAGPGWSPGACALFCTDDYAPYDAALPAGRHYVGKDQTQSLSRATMPGSGTGSPASAAAPASCPGRSRWSRRPWRCSPSTTATAVELTLSVTSGESPRSRRRHR